MNKSAETKLGAATIWDKRTIALLEFIEKEQESVENEINTVADAVKESEIEFRQQFNIDTVAFDKLKKRLEKDVPLSDFILWIIFMHAYEHRQRNICSGLLDLLYQFTEGAAIILQPSFDQKKGYSPRHLWRVLLNEASTDLQIIQAAVQQRSPGKENQPDGKVSSQQTLFTADIISEHALGQAVKSGYLKHTPVITYLKEDITVRTVPYAKVVLISVAFASMQPGFGERDKEGVSYLRVSRDMLAIAHEVGHHLFWQGNMPGRRRSVYKHLQKRLKRAQIGEWDWRRAWLEEIFADTYGCLVAGPVMALSFQDILTDNPPSLLRKDTGHHPIPALRPYIQTRILRGITDANGNPLYMGASKQLDARWEKWLAGQEWAIADPLEMEYKLHGLAHQVQGWQILEALDVIIKIVLRTLRGQRPPHTDNWVHGSWKAWTSDLQDNEGLVELYNNLTFKSFPASGLWLKVDEVEGKMSDLPHWPERILSGWSVEGPEHSGTG